MLGEAGVGDFDADGFHPAGGDALHQFGAGGLGGAEVEGAAVFAAEHAGVDAFALP